MRKNVKKQFWCTREEAHNLRMKSMQACLSEAALVRMLLKGYEPKEKPDVEFYQHMKELSTISNNLNQLAAKAHSLGFVDAPKLQEEVERWHQFQRKIEGLYLSPERMK